MSAMMSDAHVRHQLHVNYYQKYLNYLYMAVDKTSTTLTMQYFNVVSSNYYEH